MSKQKTIALIFLAVSLVQLALPASRILQHEKTMKNGRVFKLKTVPVDPYDAFRGRYVALRFAADMAKWPPGKKSPEYGTRLFVRLEEGADGFTNFGEASLEPPAEGDYLKAAASYRSSNGQIGVEIPFNRFYMEESIAPEAEKVFRQQNSRFFPFNQSQSSQPQTYATVRVLRGLGVIEQVYIGDKTLADMARAELQKVAK